MHSYLWLHQYYSHVDPHVIDVVHQKTKKLGPKKIIGYLRKNTRNQDGEDNINILARSTKYKL